MRKLNVLLKVYIPLTLFVLSWWYIAFRPSTQDLATTRTIADQKGINSNLTLLDSAFQISRTDIQKALSGNTSLMSRLIAEWDIDALIMQSNGIQPIQRLSTLNFVRSQWIQRQLASGDKQYIASLQKEYRQQFIIDAANNTILLEKPYLKVLPQTFAAASFLLALAPIEQIVGLPKRLREQEQLYTKELTSKIPLDIDRHNGEKLFLANPEIAFVANYSHPATIQALANQGVVIYTMKNPATLEDIKSEILNTGHIIDRPLEAELLNIFIDAAMISLDNRISLLNTKLEQQNKHPTMLFLNYHQNYSLSTQKSLTGQLLTRLERINTTLPTHLTSKSNHEWTIPIGKEQILNLNPDCLIISTQHCQALEKEIRKDEALKQLTAIKNNHLYFVDEVIQQSPTQYIVLAYYDLIQALENL